MFGQDERSPLWGLAAGGSLIGGAAYAFSKNKSAFADVLKSNLDVASSVGSRIADAPGFVTVRNMPSAVGSVSSELSSLVQDLPKSTIRDIEQLTYRSIMAGKTATHEEALSALSVVRKQGSPLEAYEAAVEKAGALGGDIGEIERGMKGIGSVPSESIVRRAGVSEGGFGFGFQYEKFADLSEDAQSRYTRLKSNLESAAGRKIDIRVKNISDIIDNEVVTTPMATAEIAGESFNIPLADTKYTYGGKGYTARYATRGAYTATGHKMTYSQLAEQTLIDALSGAQSHREVKQNLLQAHQTLIDQMNSRDSDARAAAVWTLPEPVAPSGSKARTRILAQEAIASGKITEEEVINLLGHGFYGYTSPSAAAKGTLATQNLATGLYGPLGAFMSAEQKPTQFIRGEWGVTGEAKRRAKAFKGAFGQAYSRLDRKMKGELYDPLIYGKGVNPLSAEAYSSPQLLTFYAKPAAKKEYGIGYKSGALNELLSAEEGVISKSVTGQMEHERVIQKKIALDEGFRVNKQISEQLKDVPPGSGVSPVFLGENQFVGIEKGTGKEIITSRGDAIENVVGAEITGPNEANVFIRERRRLSEDEYWKFFSEENKFMASAASEEKMRKTIKAAGVGDLRKIAGQEIEAVFSGKLVGRNKMALLNQQIEAASMFLGRKIDRGTIASPAAQEFLADPIKALNVKSLMASSAADADFQIQKNLVGLTRKWGFSGFETQLTFGLTDLDVAAKLEKQTNFRGFSRLVERAPGVVGLGKMKLGDRAAEGGAGRIGSFETTGFRALAMKGETGESFAAELRNRLLGKGDITESDRMFASVIGEQGFFDKFKRRGLENLTDIDPEELFVPEGREVSLGRRMKELGGSSSLYVPGLETSPDIMAPSIVKGERVQSPAAKSIMSFQGSLSKHVAGKIGDEELEAAAATLRTNLARVSEQQAFAKSKVLGSRVLTGIRGNFAKDRDTFRISKSAAEGMFDELIDRAESGEQVDFLKQQRKAAMEEQVLTGGMWRHPTTGPESFQFVKYKVDKDLADGMLAAPKEYGKLHIEGKTRPVDVSAMVGFKGDFDRDQFVISAIADRDNSNRIAKQIDHGMKEQYNRYVFNHYAMKDSIEGRLGKSSVLDMTSKEALEMGYKQHTTAKTSTGKVNLALQKLKIGVSAAAPEKYRPLAEMFWHLEEAAISGKHGVLESELYQAIASSVNKGGERGIRDMEAVIKSLMGEARTIRGEITDSFGNRITQQIDYNPRQWAETAVGSLDAVRDDVNAVMRSASFAKGNVDANIKQLTEQFHARRSGSVDIAQSLMQGTSDEFTTKTSRAMRRGAVRAKGFMSAVKKGSKPLMVGAAAAAGIMLMSPSTSGVLRKPEGSAGGRNMPPEDYGPPNGGPIQPPPPGPNRSPRTYDIGSGNRTSHANIRMRINDLDSSSRDFMASARALSDGSGVRINAKDDRSILDPRLLASKIHERL